MVNIRKIKSVRTVKGVNKALNIKMQESKDRVTALGTDDAIGGDDN